MGAVNFQHKKQRSGQKLSLKRYDNTVPLVNFVSASYDVGLAMPQLP